MSLCMHNIWAFYSTVYSRVSVCVCANKDCIDCIFVYFCAARCTFLLGDITCTKCMFAHANLGVCLCVCMCVCLARRALSPWAACEMKWQIWISRETGRSTVPRLNNTAALIYSPDLWRQRACFQGAFFVWHSLCLRTSSQTPSRDCSPSDSLEVSQRDDALTGTPLAARWILPYSEGKSNKS